MYFIDYNIFFVRLKKERLVLQSCSADVEIHWPFRCCCAVAPHDPTPPWRYISAIICHANPRDQMWMSWKKNTICFSNSFTFPGCYCTDT